MQLRYLKYSERLSTGGEWTLTGLQLGQRNLIVGKNASGKTRTLNIIGALSRQLAGLIPLALSGNYDATFCDESGILSRYELNYTDSLVLLEKFTVNGEVKLDRHRGGEGEIWASQLGNGSFMKFQTPPNQLAAVVRRDTIQHAFLEPLHNWASSLRHYYFGSSLGKETLGFFIEGGPKPDERDSNAVMGLFRVGNKEFGDPFRRAIINDINSVGYEVEEIGIGAPVSIRVTHQGLGEIGSLYVRERRLSGITDQWAMSQGMYRVLALFIHVNYCQFKRNASCIIVDDIGEGLDFEL